MKKKKEHYKTTGDDFKLFRKEAKHYLDKFSLADWEVSYEHKDIGNAEAHCRVDAYNHNVTLALSNELDLTFEREVTKNEHIKLLAKHEVIHVLLGDLAEIGSWRYVTRDQMISCEEGLVRKLVKLL